MEDAPYDWKNDQWAFTGDDSDETIRVQFIEHADGGINTATGLRGAGHTHTATADAEAPPAVDWISGDWRAVRLHARNSDGRWACALIVVQAEADGVQAGTTSRYNANTIPSGGIQTTTTAGSEAARNNSRLMNAWMSGIWYDSGDVVTEGEGLHDCSPVDVNTSTNTERASFPESSDEWEIDDVTGGASDPVRTLRRAL